MQAGVHHERQEQKKTEIRKRESERALLNSEVIDSGAPR
jgi:hypothetical protein